MARRTLTPNQRERILERDGYVCFYCLGDADVVDHIIPWSYNYNDHPNNLVASCSLCNNLAGDKVFKTVEAKARYIRRKRESRRYKVCYTAAVCADCGAGFTPGVLGASNLLCGDCYEPQEIW